MSADEFDVTKKSAIVPYAAWRVALLPTPQQKIWNVSPGLPRSTLKLEEALSFERQSAVKKRSRHKPVYISGGVQVEAAARDCDGMEAAHMKGARREEGQVD